MQNDKHNKIANNNNHESHLTAQEMSLVYRWHAIQTLTKPCACGSPQGQAGFLPSEQSTTSSPSKATRRLSGGPKTSWLAAEKTSSLWIHKKKNISISRALILAISSKIIMSKVSNISVKVIAKTSVSINIW